MKHAKKILVLFMVMTILCSAAAGVTGTGVTYTDSCLINRGFGYHYYDDSVGDYVWAAYEPNDEMYSELNDWLINTPYWVVDVFFPGFSTRMLVNDPAADGKTIDFEITPYNGPLDTVIVADIPEEYRELYNEFAAKERKTDPGAKIEVSNIVRKKKSLTFDLLAYGKFDIGWDEYLLEPDNTKYVHIYSVVSDKETGEIIRYDHVFRTAIDPFVMTYFPPDAANPLQGPTDPVKNVTVDFPADFDPEKHEYGFCFLVFDYGYSDHFPLIYTDDESDIYNYTKIDVPEWNKILGDADGNGTVGVTDIIYAKRKLAGGKGRINWDADMNDDDCLDAKDVAILRRYLSSKK